MPGFGKIAFTQAVRQHQERAGSRASYARMESKEQSVELGPEEIAFIESRDSFYIASVNSEGWPYMQHRGGPRGFIRAADSLHLEFADYGGNRQYITAGNLDTNDRVALFFMDYPSRTRLKVLGHARFEPKPDGMRPPDGYRAKIERIMRIEVAAWDWNCPQHITPRYTIEEIEAMMQEQHRSET